MPEQTPQFDARRALNLAAETLQIEIEAIDNLKNRLAGTEAALFTKAVLMLLNCTGRIVVSGMASPDTSHVKSLRPSPRPARLHFLSTQLKHCMATSGKLRSMMFL